MALVLIPAVRRAGLRFRPGLRVPPPGREAAAAAVGLDARLRHRQPGHGRRRPQPRRSRAPATPAPTSTRSRSSSCPTACWRCRSPRRSPRRWPASVTRRDRAAFCDQVSLGIRLVALLTLPAGVLLFVLRRAIIGALLQHGEYTAADADNAARALGRLRPRARRVLAVPVRAARVLRPPGHAHAVRHQRRRRTCSTSCSAFALVGRYDILGLAAALAISYVVCALWALQVHVVQGARASRCATCMGSLWRMVVAGAVAGEVDVARGDQASATTSGCRRVRPARRRRRWSASSSTSGSCWPLRAPELTAAAVPAARPPSEPASSKLAPCSSSPRSGGSYLTAKLTGSFNERADPKVQLEQAIAEAQNQHRRLQGAGGQRHRQPEAERDAAQRQDDRAREAQRQRPPGADHGGRRPEGGRRRRRRRSTRRPPRRSPTS